MSQLSIYTFVLILILLIHYVQNKMFDSDPSSESRAMFPTNECFKSSAELTTWLLKTTSGASYKRFNRPGLNESSSYSAPLPVNVSVDMNSMASMDDINSEYTIMLKIDLEWLDERLKLKDQDCNTSQPVTMPLDPYHLERIWYPRLGVSNIKDPDTSIIQGEARMTVGQYRNDGYIHIRWALLLNLVCYLDFSLFPFDRQVCFIKLESRSYPKSHLRLVWHSDHPFRNLENFRMNGFELANYQLLNDSSPRCSAVSGLIMPDTDIYGVERMSQIVVRLVVSREWINYFLEIYVPSILCVVSSWLSFWLEVNAAPARVSLGMTTMLTLVTSSQSIRDKLPRLGYIHALDVWIVSCTFLIFLSLIEFAIVSNFQRACQCTKSRATRQSYLPGMFTIGSTATNLFNDLYAEKPPCSAEKRAQNVDICSRILFPTIFILFNITYWVVYLMRKNKTDEDFQ